MQKMMGLMRKCIDDYHMISPGDKIAVGVAFCQRLAEAGCKAIIYTDIACDGAMKGTNLALYRQLAKEVPGVAITASGGISSEKELLELEKMGTAAAILGKSLYTGALDLGRCVALVQK